MPIKQGHNFNKKDGFSGSAGMVPVRAHLRKGGRVKVSKIEEMQQCMDKNMYRREE